MLHTLSVVKKDMFAATATNKMMGIGTRVNKTGGILRNSLKCSGIGVNRIRKLVRFTVHKFKILKIVKKK
jgi:hypothetical protein